MSPPSTGGDLRSRHTAAFRFIQHLRVRGTFCRSRDLFCPAEVGTRLDRLRGLAPNMPQGILDDPVLWWLISFALGVAATTLFVFDFWQKRQALAQTMRRFGGDFVREFARPWTQYRGAGPLPRARLRISPRRERVEILVAPPPGRPIRTCPTTGSTSSTTWRA